MLPLPRSEDDAEFIAHAREDVPALLAEVERLRATVARVEALPDTWTGMDEDERIAHVVECKDYTCPDCPVIACIYDLSRALADPEPQP